MNVHAPALAEPHRLDDAASAFAGDVTSGAAAVTLSAGGDLQTTGAVSAKSDVTVTSSSNRVSRTEDRGAACQ